ncbi:MAG: HEAT repeat domain-containing protein [Methylobacter sp.]
MTCFPICLNWPLILIVLSIISTSPSVILANEQVPANQTPAPKFVLRLEGKRLTAEFRNVPLRDIAEALKTKANARILLDDPEIANEPISVRIRSKTLEDAMKIILDGFSYALDSSAQPFTVVVLSTPPQRFRGTETLESTCLSNSTDASTPSPEGNQASSQTVDKSRSPMLASGECATMDTKNIDNSSSLSAENTNQEQEAVLQRALDILDSPQKHLYADAIDQLGMVQDEQASAVLIRFAQQPQQGPERYLATEALARIAVQSQFKDAKVIKALEQLASDENEDIRQSASLVIDQMHQVELPDK